MELFTPVAPSHRMTNVHLAPAQAPCVPPTRRPEGRFRGPSLQGTAGPRAGGGSAGSLALRQGRLSGDPSPHLTHR